MPNLKFLAQTIPDIWRGSQNFKSRSRAPFPILFSPNLHFFISALVVNLHAKLKFLVQTVPDIQV